MPATHQRSALIATQLAATFRGTATSPSYVSLGTEVSVGKGYYDWSQERVESDANVRHPC